MSDSVRDLLVRGIAAAKANDRDEARYYLEWVLRSGDADLEHKADAWLWLSQITDDPARKRECLEYVLAIDPSHALARRGLALLDGRLKPEDQIDHRQPVQPVQPDARPSADSVRRYVCPQCGGQMAFEPGQRALRCGYCGNRLWEAEALQQGALVREQDFAAMLPTARAHRWELPTARSVACEGCGARFTLPPSHASGACPFCGSSHIVAWNQHHDLIQPEGVLPFAFDAEAASQHVRDWLKQQRFRPGDLGQTAIASPHGLYLPFWTYDIGGEVKWHALVQEGSGNNRRWVPRSGSYLVFHNDLPVPASHSLPRDLSAQLLEFDTNALVPYSSDVLAGWPVEVYQISMADASLVARQRALGEARHHIDHRSLGGQTVKDLTLDSLGITIDTYKLVLLPVWLSSYRYRGQAHAVVVNGRSGRVAGSVPRSGFQKVLAGLFGGGT